jgi:hypothetical protein
MQRIQTWLTKLGTHTLVVPAVSRGRGAPKFYVKAGFKKTDTRDYVWNAPQRQPTLDELQCSSQSTTAARGKARSPSHVGNGEAAHERDGDRSEGEGVLLDCQTTTAVGEEARGPSHVGNDGGGVKAPDAKAPADTSYPEPDDTADTSDPEPNTSDPDNDDGTDDEEGFEPSSSDDFEGSAASDSGPASGTPDPDGENSDDDEVSSITSDSEGELQPGTITKPPRGASSSGCVARTNTKTKFAKPAVFRDLSTKEWDVKQRSEGSLYASMLHTKTGQEYTVAFTRVGKAQLHLTPDSFLEPQRETSCTCARSKCCQVLDTSAIKAIRTAVYTQCDTEDAVSEYICGKLKASSGDFVLKAEKVCRTYYGRVHSVGSKRLSNLRKIVKDGKKRPSKESRHRGKASSSTQAVKTQTAYTFWHTFFEQNCQRPNDEIRLWPVYKTYEVIFKEYFTPWFNRLLKAGHYTESARPAFQSWRSARHHPDFKDVVDRPKHYHARCETCRDLSNLLLNAFADGAAEEEYQRQRKLHDAEVHAWRNYERNPARQKRYPPTHFGTQKQPWCFCVFMGRDSF